MRPSSPESPPESPADLLPDGRAPRGTPLYLHLPLCVRKCTYCDFYSLVAEGEDPERLVSALLEEAGRRAPREPRTVFLGGGTPSLLSEELLSRLLEGLQATTDFRSSAEEVTVECNPESLDGSKAKTLRGLGVDRLSIGLQSLRPEILELFDRPHGVEEGASAFAAARAAGFRRVSVDLIYAVPGQDPELWERDLARVLALEPDHVSAYHLAFEDGTQLTRMLAEGRLRRPPEELERRFFLRTRDQLDRAGYSPYEISNFAPKGQECRHNQNYWRNGPYVGLGPSAVSHVGGRRSGNVRSLGAWQERIEAGRSAEAWDETLAPLPRLGETWWLGLRTREGVDPAVARRTAAWGEGPDPAAELAGSLAGEGWLEERAGAFGLSGRGLPLADALAARFLDLDAPAVPNGAAEGAGARGSKIPGPGPAPAAP